MESVIPRENARVYAIGDIHGRLDLLDRAIDAIRDDVARHGGEALTVTLGDYIDRGPSSAGVIERLADNPFPTPYVALKGNHEAMLEMFLDDADFGPHWRGQGGEETLASYGVTARGPMKGKANSEALEALRAAMPAKHLDFLNALRMSFSHGAYFFCHAGVRPGVPLDKQSEHDLMWIRWEFLMSGVHFGKIIVHGHTPVPVPEVLPNRINIDTQAFASGRLTCVVLEAERIRFLEV